MRDGGSFRDPRGFVFAQDGTVFRQVAATFADGWDDLIASGLLDRLAADRLILPFEIVADAPGVVDATVDAHQVIKPEQLDFVSYPFEWSFSQLKDAALLTLDIQARSLASGFTLRDASAYNVQFQHGGPIHIDTLSFERQQADAPWVAYRQFCEHFLAPLALMAHRDIRFGAALRTFPDGIPLGFAARMLPARTRFNVGLGAHIHLHARAQRTQASTAATSAARVGETRTNALIDSLRRTVESLTWGDRSTEWSEYDLDNSYGNRAAADKDAIVGSMLEQAGGGVIWDIGANIGRHSTIAAGLGRRVISLDSDPGATELHYLRVRARAERNILPLLQDFADPTPRFGWDLAERRSLFDRANADVTMMLALVHHLAIGRNIPLGHIFRSVARLGTHLIIEFVPKDDPMVQRLLAAREDVFSDYSMAGFVDAMTVDFEILDQRPIVGSSRVLFLARARRA